MTKKNIILILTIGMLFTMSDRLHAQWIRQQVSSDAALLLTIDFSNDSTGSAGGWAPGFFGRIVHTTNGGITGIGKQTGEWPHAFQLEQNYPNPFNPSTTISYQLPTRSQVTLKIFDLLGREVATVIDGVEEPGHKFVNFNANGLSSGVYYYRLQAGTYSETRKFVLMK